MKINWKELRDQKQWLANTLNGPTSTYDDEMMMGIYKLIDSIQQDAVDGGVPACDIYGESE